MSASSAPFPTEKADRTGRGRRARRDRRFARTNRGARTEKALAYLALDQITLVPDCGFAPTSTNPISLDEAYQKLRAMSEAASILRARYS